MNFKILLIPLFLFSCLRTTKDIHAEQVESEEIEKIEEQKQVQKNQTQELLSNLMGKNKELEEQIMLLQGKVDDLSYQRQSQSTKEIPQTTSISPDQSTRIQNIEVKLDELSKEMQTQREFIQKVTENLIKIQKSLSK